jgi:uncharacterized surface anchored protein
MRSTSLFSSRTVARALAISVATGLAALSVDACQSDSTVAPESSLRSDQVSADRGGQALRPGSGIMTWQLKDGSFIVPLAGGEFQLTGPNNYSLSIKDNVTPADQDPADGAFKVMGLLPGIYTLCQTAAPPKFLMPDPKLVSWCTQATIVSNGTNSGAQFFNYHIPRSAWTVVDPVGNLLGGSYFTLYDSLNVQTPILDDSPQDQDPAFGKFLKEIAIPGIYKLCQTLAPSGYQLPAAPCKSIAASPGFIQNQGKWVNTPNYSVYFDVTDPNGKPLSGTTFAILRQYYSPNMQVADNITPDRDPVTGKYFVILPAAGFYVICQHDAPYGYDVPKANGGCSPVALNVKLGVPANGGTFVDTPWPVPR